MRNLTYFFSGAKGESQETNVHLEQKLTYKAMLSENEVLKVPADYTSQRCPVCWTIDKDARDKRSHTYTCKCCGYSTNDDRVGAINLYQLGKEYVNGNTKPGIRKG